MARKRVISQSSGRSILFIDDNAEYLRASKRLLDRDGHEIITALSGGEALELLRARRVDLVLVDYHMPGMNGEEFVRELRTFDPLVQVILQTGYASEHPPREMLRHLDIQGYHDKSDGPDKLRLWIDIGLKAAYATQLLERSRQGLRYILGVTPELHKLQPLEQLLQGILLQTAGLLGATDALLAVMADRRDEQHGFVAMAEDGGDITVRASTGRFVASSRLSECISSERMDEVMAALSLGRCSLIGQAVLAPLKVGATTLGLIYLEQPIAAMHDRELVEIFANQAAVAIHNAALYELAALDPLTGVYARRFFEQALLRELRNAYRSGAPLGVMMIDLDGMKGINDSLGHLAGDAALQAAANVLRGAVRATDVVGRLGGDEFAILLPGADSAGVLVASARVQQALADLSVTTGRGPVAVRGSVGVAVLESDRPDIAAKPQSYFERVARYLLDEADQRLYRSKRAQSAAAALIAWPAAADGCAVPETRCAAD